MSCKISMYLIKKQTFPRICLVKPKQILFLTKKLFIELFHLRFVIALELSIYFANFAVGTPPI